MSHESEFGITGEDQKEEKPFTSGSVEGIHLGLEDRGSLPAVTSLS